MGRKTKDVFDYLVEVAGAKVATEIFKRFQGEIVTIWNKDSEFCKILAKLSNKSVLKDFMSEFNREQVYIGIVDNFFLEARNDEILRRYDGTNIKDLTKEYNLSEARIGKIVRTKRKKYKSLAK